MILSATLFLLGVLAYSIKDLQSFHKLKWMGSNYFSFWGEQSHYRKYKMNRDAYIEGYALYPAKNNWYTRLFGIKYREKWFTSTWLTVSFTDGFHMCQALAKIFICFAFYPLTNWWFAVVLWVLWGVCFSLCDKYLTK